MIHYSRMLSFIIPLLFGWNLNAAKQDTKAENLLTEAYNIKDTDIKKAFKLIRIALTIAQDNNSISPLVKSDVYSVAGTLNQDIHNYNQAIEYHFAGLKIREKNKDMLKIANSHLNLANAYYESSHYDKASTHFELSLHFLKQLPPQQTDPQDFIPIYSGMGTMYESLGKMDSALFYFQKALYCVKISKKPPDVATINLYGNLGKFYETLQNYPKALQYFNLSVSFQIQDKNWSGLAWSYNRIGYIHMELKDYDTAAVLLNKAQSLAMMQLDKEGLKDIYDSKLHLFCRTNSTDSLRIYLDHYLILNEELEEALSKKNLLESEIKYDLQNERNKKQQADLKQRYYLNISIATFFILLAIIFILIRNYRQKQRISLMQLDIKNREINYLLHQQETASYAAMLEGQDQERQRIARELHDRLGSTLAAVKLGIQGDPVSTYQQNLELVDKAIDEIRSVAHDLSGGNIEKYGIIRALNELKQTLERSGNLEFQLFPEIKGIVPSLQVPLYRIIQELVSNTLKYAHATSVIVQISDMDHYLYLIYEDNGVGFDLQHIQPGMGLKNIRHRLAKWNGSMTIDSRPGRGTIVIIQIPHTYTP